MTVQFEAKSQKNLFKSPYYKAGNHNCQKEDVLRDDCVQF